MVGVFEYSLVKFDLFYPVGQTHQSFGLLAKQVKISGYGTSADGYTYLTLGVVDDPLFLKRDRSLF